MLFQADHAAKGAWNVYHQDVVAPADVPARDGRDAGAAAARSMVPAMTATAKTRGRTRRAASARSSSRSASGRASGRRRRPATNFEFTPILKPLEKFRDHVTVVSELCDPLDGHATTVAAWLSGTIPKRTDRRRRPQRHHDRPGDRQADRPGHGVPVDRARDRRLHRLHRRLRPRLRLRLHEHASWASADHSRCRWRSIRASSSSGCSAAPARAEPAPGPHAERQEHPRFGAAGRQGSAGRPRARRTAPASSDYLENVREIEKRIQRAEKQATTEITVPDAPIGVPESFEEHVGLQFDLLALALRSEHHARCSRS